MSRRITSLLGLVAVAALMIGAGVLVSARPASAAVNCCLKSGQCFENVIQEDCDGDGGQFEPNCDQSSECQETYGGALYGCCAFFATHECERNYTGGDIACTSAGGEWDPQCVTTACKEDFGTGSDDVGCCLSGGECSQGISKSECEAGADGQVGTNDDGGFDANCQQTVECREQVGGEDQQPMEAPSCKADYIKGTIQGGLFTGVSKECLACGECQLCDILGLANQIARMIFSVFGAVAFLFFLWGGVNFIFAAGNTERVEKGKLTLRNAVIGIFIIAFAWQIVHIVLITVGVEQQKMGGARLIFGKPWDDPCTGATSSATIQQSTTQPSQ